jgi:hypothetical protein
MIYNAIVAYQFDRLRKRYPLSLGNANECEFEASLALTPLAQQNGTCTDSKSIAQGPYIFTPAEDLPLLQSRMKVPTLVANVKK